MVSLNNDQLYEQACLLYDKKEYNKALEIFINLSKDNDSDAQNTVACMYHDGLGTKKDNSIAEYWWDKAIKDKNENAMYQKGKYLLYHNDISSAIELLTEASLHCHDDASYLLGTYYFSGIHVSKDQKKAVQYFQKAAIEGNSEAIKGLITGLFIIHNPWHARIKLIKFIFLYLQHKIKFFLQ